MGAGADRPVTAPSAAFSCPAGSHWRAFPLLVPWICSHSPLEFGFENRSKRGDSRTRNGKRMVDRLKKSLEHLDPPHCPKCAIEMAWSRSFLADAATFVHVFICPSCSNTAETKTKVRATSVPPRKLSAPRDQQ